jgi:hypothetical protein
MHRSDAITVVIPIKIEGPKRKIVLRLWLAAIQHDSFAAIGTAPGMLLLILRDGWRGPTRVRLGRRKWREAVNRECRGER